MNTNELMIGDLANVVGKDGCKMIIKLHEQNIL